jgi:hypothetical protein
MPEIESATLGGDGVGTDNRPTSSEQNFLDQTALSRPREITWTRTDKRKLGCEI